MITELLSNQIFVFGSNLAGKHGRGAALTALQRFGAVYGEGEGLFGNSYAFPTLDENLRKLDESGLIKSVSFLLRTAINHPGLEFILTEVGCGLAGFTKEYMRDIFRRVKLPPNIRPYHNWLEDPIK